MEFFLMIYLINAIGIVIIIIAVCCSKHASGGGPVMDTKLPDGSEYKDKVGTPPTEHPELADQLDGRLTNVFTNPMKGVL